MREGGGREKESKASKHSMPYHRYYPEDPILPSAPAQAAGNETEPFDRAQLLSQGSSAGNTSEAALSSPPSHLPTPPARPRGASEDGAGSTTFSFGEYKGRTFADIFANEKCYVGWARKLVEVTNEQMQQFIDFIGATSAQAQRPRSPRGPGGEEGGHRLGGHVNWKEEKEE